MNRRSRKKSRQFDGRFAPRPGLFFDGEKSVHVFRAAIVAFSILVGAGSFYLAHQATYYSNEAAILRHAKEEKITWMRQIDGAILNMRKLRYDIVRECTYGTPLPLKEQDALRTKALFAFIEAYIGSRFIFNEAIQNKARELVKLDYSIKDVCAQNAPNDTAWKEIMLEMDNIMVASLSDDNKKLLETTTKVAEVKEAPFWKFLWPY